MTEVTLAEVAELYGAPMRQVERWAVRGLLGTTRRKLTDDGYVVLVALDAVLAFAPQAAQRVVASTPIAERKRAVETLTKRRAS
jgi:hypothetical protein